MATRTKRVGDERLIKKYPNRRLYDTQTSTYVTLADIKQLVMASESFKVLDAKTDEDLTRSILLQIILEEEACGMPIFSTQMLQQMIRFYGHSMQGLMGSHLERTMQSFMDMQQKLSEQSKSMTGGGTEAWTQMMNLQNPFMQNLMTNYMDQSKDLFLKMQEQMQGSNQLFTGYPFKSKSDASDSKS
ncbi:MAG: polyhydroxyalkanoate synthesis repressor PhaR [Burkholderiaceae bacterium]|nr:polyhydroxyalkanoate synthesis repressor PhaR [Burkholderiaceae bacterium]